MRLFAKTRLRAAAAGLVLTAWVLAARPLAAEEPLVFESDILPIVTAHCFKCHGFEDRKANLDLRTVVLMTRGGEHGAVIKPGSAAESKLYRRMADRSMPPQGELPLEDAKIERVRRWLDAGARAQYTGGPPTETESQPVTAEDRTFWAFRKPERPATPALHSAEARTPIDAFVLERLSARSLAFSPPATRVELVRRAWFDLAGLPPSPEEVARFTGDSDPEAFERLLDRLLASPHFGERFGRHWLDASGYVDTIGDDTDAAITKLAIGKWQYRDYVIRSFNADKPFDRFLSEQLAGDELSDWRTAERLSPDAKELLVATGMLRAAADETMQNELNTADIRESVLEHTLEVVTNNLLGLTVNCARCHSHKFDPIPQEDYYRLLAIFSPAFNHQSWLQPPQREIPDLSRPEKALADKHNAEIDEQVKERKSRLSALRGPYEARLQETKLATIPEPIRADTKVAVATPAKNRNEIQKYLAGKFEAALKVSAEEVTAALNDADRTTDKTLSGEIKELDGRRRTWDALIQAVYDVGPPPPTYLLRRGNLDRPGIEVSPGFLRVLCEADGQACVDGSPIGEDSRRRLAFARWLTRRDSAAAGLVARVYVNRVWQYLFGQGIVATSENLGNSGARPTHPELLDYLAFEFQHNGWRIKPLVRQIMTSNVYRQASHRPNAPAAGPDPESIDPANELLWQMRPRQMESESVRDAILVASGLLEPSRGGPPTPLDAKPDGTVIVKKDKVPESQQNRRSVYLVARRRYNVSLLDAFDQPELTSNCARRTSSAVVSQALTLLNDDFVIEKSAAMAARVEREAADRDGRIERAFQIALARLPEPAEKAWAAELLDRQQARYQATAPAEAQRRAWASLCQMLLNTNEFLYVP